MDLLHLEINVLVAQLDVYNVLKILSAIIVLIINSFIKVAVSKFALQELLEIDLLETGNVFLAIHHAKHV